MKNELEELLGSLVGAAKTDCGSGIIKRIKRSFKLCRRQQRCLKIVNNQGGNINFYLIDSNKENIENLIMENKNYLKP